jgi:hypothetical protein
MLRRRAIRVRRTRFRRLMAGHGLHGAFLRRGLTRRLDPPLRMASATDCLRFEQESIGALHQMLAGLDPQERRQA